MLDEDPTAGWVCVRRPEAVAPPVPPTPHRGLLGPLRDRWRHEAELLRGWEDEPDPAPEETWAFRCSDGERRVKGPRYAGLIAAQAERPQAVLETLDGPRWWMYQDRCYRADEDLDADDVLALIHEAGLLRAERLARARSRLARDEAATPSDASLSPPEVAPRPARVARSRPEAARPPGRGSPPPPRARRTR